MKKPTKQKPTLVFIPGFWEGITVFSQVVNTLTSTHNYRTKTVPLPSTGTNGPNVKDFSSDVEAVRAVVEDFVDQGKEIVLVMHSAGGYIGSQAIEHLSLAERKQRGEAGGVRKLVFLAGAILPEGADHPERPLFETTGDRMRCRDPVPTLFHDLFPSEAERHAAQLSWQPAGYVSSVHVTYGAWKEIPSAHLCCSQDKTIPLEWQRQFVEMAGGEAESCDAGHMVMLSQPELVVEFVKKAAEQEEEA